MHSHGLLFIPEEPVNIADVNRSILSHWRSTDIAAIDRTTLPETPVIGANDVKRLIPAMDLWDMWPVETRNGCIADVAGGSLWMALSAPLMPDPGQRHFHARIRLLHKGAAGWRDLGNALPEGFGCGNREWAGSAVLDGDVITLFYTAAGFEGVEGGYQQRIFETRGIVDAAGQIHDWSPPAEIISADGIEYEPADQMFGEAGRIWAFRDPSHFRDPVDGVDYLFFTGSLAGSQSAFRGAIGLARKESDGSWNLLSPIVAADGLNNELERPHVRVRNGRYHLFWSTQCSVFATGGPAGPNGLYAMVADSLLGPWHPVNRSGLVLCNPEAEPTQAYSWWVLDTLEVVSFIDHWGLKGRSISRENPSLARSSFGGTPAPLLSLRIDGDRIKLVRSHSTGMAK